MNTLDFELKYMNNQSCFQEQFYSWKMSNTLHWFKIIPWSIISNTLFDISGMHYGVHLKFSPMTPFFFFFKMCISFFHLNRHSTGFNKLVFSPLCYCWSFLLFLMLDNHSRPAFHKLFCPLASLSDQFSFVHFWRSIKMPVGHKSTILFQ